MYLKCMHFYKTKQWFWYPTQTISCKFGCSRAEDAYGVEAQGKFKHSPVSNSQSNKFHFKITVLLCDLDFFGKNRDVLCFFDSLESYYSLIFSSNKKKK